MGPRSLAALVAITTVSLLGTAPARAAVPGWGKRSQVGQLVRQLDAMEKGSPRKPGFLRRQPIAQKLAAFLRPGLSVKNDVERLDDFLAKAQAKLGGGPISTLQHPALVDGRRMRVEKAMALLEYGRRPGDVTEEIIRTQVKVKGAEDLRDRDLFIQRWKPIGRPSGKVYVLSPGFLQSGRNFLEQVQLLNQEGHDVIVMDHQWAGYTADAEKGVLKGGIDRGFGIARDVAEVAAHANGILEAEYGDHPGKQLVLVGTSMGGGPGVLGALKLYDAGRITLGEGRSIPKDRGWIVQGAFLGRTRGLINNSLDFLGRIPILRNLRLPALGLPLLSDDKGVNAKLAAHAAAEDLRGRPQSFRAALADLSEILQLINDTGGPAGRGYVIHSERDHLANPKIVIDAVRKMGGDVKLDLLRGRDHVVEEHPVEQRRILEGAKFVGGEQ